MVAAIKIGNALVFILKIELYSGEMFIAAIFIKENPLLWVKIFKRENDPIFSAKVHNN